jgi:putative copper resistance protein D
MGAPSTLYLQTSSRRHKERWLGIIRSRPFAVLTHPLLVAFLYFGVMYIFFLSSLINVAMTHMWLMDIINLVFLSGGLLAWWPMVGIDPIIHWKIGFGARMAFVLVGSAIDAFLGVAILNLSHPVASMYSLSSTHAGGGLLWAGTDVLALVGFAPIYIQWMRSEERAGKRSDLRQAKQRVAYRNGGDEGPVTTRGPAIPLKVSAWEAAWQQRAGGTPTIREAPDDAFGPAIPPPLSNGNGSHTY